MSNKRDSSLERLPGLALLLALLTAAGLLVATLAVPLVLGTGLAAKSTADHFDALPTGLPDPVLGVDSRILAADGSVLAVLHGPQNRVPVRIEQVAPVRSVATTAPHPARPDQTRPFPGAELRCACGTCSTRSGNSWCRPGHARGIHDNVRSNTTTAARWSPPPLQRSARGYAAHMATPGPADE